MQKLTRNLTEEENSSQCLKILTQITVEDENELAETEVFPKQLTSESFDNDNKLTLKSFFAFCSVFFYKNKRRKDGNDFQTNTVSGFQNTLSLHYRAKTYSALSFDRINFFNMANLFLLSRKAFVMCYCFCAPIKTFFFHACQMIVKSCVLHLFPVPQTGRSHIINILLTSFFRSVL